MHRQMEFSAAAPGVADPAGSDPRHIRNRVLQALLHRHSINLEQTFDQSLFPLLSHPGRTVRRAGALPASQLRGWVVWTGAGDATRPVASRQSAHGRTERWFFASVPGTQKSGPDAPEMRRDDAPVPSPRSHVSHAMRPPRTPAPGPRILRPGKLPRGRVGRPTPFFASPLVDAMSRPWGSAADSARVRFLRSEACAALDSVASVGK